LNKLKLTNARFSVIAVMDGSLPYPFGSLLIIDAITEKVPFEWLRRHNHSCPAILSPGLHGPGTNIAYIKYRDSGVIESRIKPGMIEGVAGRMRLNKIYF
jgi:hypothetical protein